MSALYFAPFIFLGAVPALFYFVGPAASAGGLAAMLASLIIAELALPARARAVAATNTFPYRFVPIFYVPAQIAVTAWGVAVAGRPSLSPLIVAELALSVGVLMGVFGMLAAHEMIHSPERWERMLGTVMLTGMMYRHFRIAHIYGHHRWAATERDAATARLSESFYGYLARTLPQQFLDAAAIESRRCSKFRRTFLHNRLHQDIAIMVVVCGAILRIAGAPGLFFFIAQSAVGIVILELFNYIAHYGLLRMPAANGGLEPPSDRHSWNSSNAFANMLILNMGRHSDHHRRSAAPYQTLAPVEQGAELPLGYAGSILLALIPPLWRRVMDPEVRRLRGIV